FDRNLILRFFTDTSWGAKNIAAIITRAVQKNYCGVTLDYEDPGTVNLPLFAAFVRALAANLRINGITLAVAMEWKYAKEAAGAWQTIGEACETVAFMGYPEHNPGTAPGPLASLALLETRLKAVARSVPIQKIALGMATYAVRWSSNKATTGTWTSIVQPALANGTRIMRDKENAAPHFTDSMGVVWYEDAKSIQKKMQMAASLGISRFALWRLGGEDPEIWKMLRNQGL
ncbi:MAG: glycosyl hydrolase family 18 protein, partial [Chloroflexi bacterium]|nr:glycosyl hydrolase family 18 protein [Chloroflexota bacterium]